MSKRNLFNAATFVGALIFAQPALARVVDYNVSDALIRQEGEELKISPLSGELDHGNRKIALTAATGVDHITTALGMYCSAYKVENPITLLLKRLAADRSIGVTSPSSSTKPDIEISVTGARSYRRCVELSEWNVRCIVRAALTGTVASVDGKTALPISADVERDSSVSGICGSLARGVRVVSREAAIQLLKNAETKIAEIETQ